MGFGAAEKVALETFLQGCRFAKFAGVFRGSCDADESRMLILAVDIGLWEGSRFAQRMRGILVFLTADLRA